MGQYLLDKKRIAVGALLFEGNTLSLVRTNINDFKNKYLVAGMHMVAALVDTNVEIAGAFAAINGAGFAIAPLLATNGGSGGRVTAECYLELKTLLLERLKAVGPIDGLYLALHGAMICEGEDDAEGDLLQSIRAIIGSVPISVSCDMHAHITRRMIESCSILVGYQHYPHDDTFETGARAAGLLIRTLKGEIKPKLRMRKVALISPPFTHGTREAGPMRQLFRSCRGVEASGDALALSYFPVQPWLDIRDVGFAAVAVTDDDADAADRLALDLVESAWARRHEFVVPNIEPREALDEGLAIKGKPIIVSDASDCVGAGAAGDSSRMLAAYLLSDIEKPLLIHVVDPDMVALAWAAGVGSVVIGDLGNKIDPSYGAPLPVKAVVTHLFHGDFTYSGGLMGGVHASMGPSAVITVGAATVVVSAFSAYEYGDEHFRAAGLSVQDFKFVVVKNPMNFKQAYAWAPKSFLVRLPGASTSDLGEIAWREAQRPFFPLDDQASPIFRTAEVSGDPPQD